MIIFVFFIAIVTLSLLFRITNMELIEFKGDEAVNLFLASRPIFGYSFPPGGTVSSMGVLNPPLINYILFPLTLLSQNPQTVSLFIGFINSLAIGLLFLLFRKYYGLLTSGVATILLALSPWSILYSRKIWPQDFLLLLLLPWLYSIHKILIDKKAYWMLYIISSLFLIQLYLPSLFIVAITTLFLLKQKRPTSLRSLFLGLALGIIPLLPFIGYQIANDYPDWTTLLAARGKGSITYDVVIFARPLQIMSQGYFSFIVGNDFVTLARDYPLAYTIRKIFYVEYLLLPLGMFLFWKKWKNLRLLVYTTILLPILYFVLRIVPHMHYFIVLMPLTFLFTAYALSRMIEDKRFFLKVLGVTITLAIIVTSFLFDKAFFDLLRSNKSLAGDYGTVFSVNEEKAKAKLQKYSGTKDFDEMLLASFIPRSFVHANAAGAKMLFPRESTQKNLKTLEQRLEEIPQDARVQLELIAYYTYPPITKDTVQYLEEKSKTFPGFQLVFEEVNRLSKEQQAISRQ